ncbi:MAG: energy-coupling factor transporter transmembrane component T [Eubacteriales bacterium]|nr:energy-coupling factor transporter transmembrane component T [Eubacteriales bacterium]
MNGRIASGSLLDPRSKLAVFIAACFSAFSGLTHPQEFALLALCVATTLLCQKWKRAFFTCLAFALMFLCDLFLVPRLSGILQNIVMLLCHLCRFILPLLTAFYVLTHTSRIGEYISAFTQMHLPNEVIIPLAVMLRFVPTIQEEWRAVNQALRLRGMALTWKNIVRRPMQMMEYMLVPFLLQCSVIVDEMSAAVMARGFDRNMPRSSYAEVQMKVLDWCIIMISTALMTWNLCF